MSGIPIPDAARDVGSVRRFLVEHLRSEVEMGPNLPQGEWSRAYAFRHADRDLVVRFNVTRESFEIDLRAMQYASARLPTPPVLEVGEMDDGFFAISERAFGEFLEELQPDQMTAVLPSLLDTLDALRVADTSSSSGFGPWDRAGQGRSGSWSAYLLDIGKEASESLRGHWRQFLRRSKTALAAFDAGMRELNALASRCSDQRSLVHSDLLNRNAFVAGMRLTALIDWQCAMYGDHLYDLA